MLYNVVVLWCALGVEAGEVRAGMDRREALLGMAEKLSKIGRRHGAGPLRHQHAASAQGPED